MSIHPSRFPLFGRKIYQELSKDIRKAHLNVSRDNQQKRPTNFSENPLTITLDVLIHHHLIIIRIFNNSWDISCKNLSY